MLLYDYFRSSAAYRVRIALALKGVTVERRFVHLLRDGGEQRRPAYLSRNPQGLVPALELDDGTVLTQSLAIIDYLDMLQPAASAVPTDPVARRAGAGGGACHRLRNASARQPPRARLSRKRAGPEEERYRQMANALGHARLRSAGSPDPTGAILLWRRAHRRRCVFGPAGVLCANASASASAPSRKSAPPLPPARNILPSAPHIRPRSRTPGRRLETLRRRQI